MLIHLGQLVDGTAFSTDGKNYVSPTSQAVTQIVAQITSEVVRTGGQLNTALTGGQLSTDAGRWGPAPPYVPKPTSAKLTGPATIAATSPRTTTATKAPAAPRSSLLDTLFICMCVGVGVVSAAKILTSTPVRG